MFLLLYIHPFPFTLCSSTYGRGEDMSVIVVGDNGTELVVPIKDDNGVVDLTTATSIKARFLRDDKTRFDKSLTVTDAQAGKCIG